MKIDQAQFWSDVGYTENSITIPKVQDVATLPTPSKIVTDDLYPTKDRLFSAIKLKGDYLEYLNYGYIAIDYLYADNSTQRIYGWIHDVRQLSDTPSFHEIIVEFAVDYWRTYAAQAVFKEGMVLRRPGTTGLPPQGYAYQKKTVKTETVKALTPSDEDYWWMYFVHTVKVGSSSQFVGLRFGCIPFYLGSQAIYIDSYSGTEPKMCPTSDLICGSLWDEFLEIDPQSIVYVGITHLPPFAHTGAGTQSSPLKPSTSAGWGMNSASSQLSAYFYFDRSSDFNVCQSFDLSLGLGYRSDDVNTTVITGYDGEPVGSIPWGFEPTSAKVRTVISASGVYTEIRFGSGTPDAAANGLCVTVPAITVDMTENSWSSYVYSGQRQYDIDHRTLDSVNSLIGSITGTATTGAMIAKKATVGAAAGAATGLIQGAIELGITNPMEQDLTDKAHANQTNGSLIPGAGFDFMVHGRDISLATLEIDSYSKSQRTNDMTVYGAHVKEATSDCQSLVTAGGPLQISGLTVGGPIPAEAKRYMMGLFAKGVRLV